MQEAVINYCRISYSRQAITGRATERFGNASQIGMSAPSGIFPCHPGGANDYVFTYTSRASDDQWHGLLDVVGRPELKANPRFAGAVQRVKHHEAIDELIAGWTRSRTKRQAMLELTAATPASTAFATWEPSGAATQVPAIDAAPRFDLCQLWSRWWAVVYISRTATPHWPGRW